MCDCCEQDIGFRGQSECATEASRAGNNRTGAQDFGFRVNQMCVGNNLKGAQDLECRVSQIVCDCRLCELPIFSPSLARRTLGLGVNQIVSDRSGLRGK